MLGHFTELPAAGAWPGVPDPPGVPEPPEDEELIVGVVVEEFVAAWAATPPPSTRTPETAMAAAVLWIARMCAHLLGVAFVCLTGLSQPFAPEVTMGTEQEAMKNIRVRDKRPTRRLIWRITPVGAAAPLVH
jgi:hypothetical protein